MTGVCSRREAETWISEGRISLNGTVVDSFSTQIDIERDRLLVDGKSVSGKKRVSTSAPLVYWLLHKPAGFVCTPNSVSSIFNLPKLKKLPFKVTAINNLAKYAEGFCLLTNDETLVSAIGSQDDYAQLVALMIDQRLPVEQLGRFFVEEKSNRPTVKFTYRHKVKIGATTGYWYYMSGSAPELRKTLEQNLRQLDVRIYKYVVLSWAGFTMPEELAAGDYTQLSARQIKQLKSLPGTASSLMAGDVK